MSSRTVFLLLAGLIAGLFLVNPAEAQQDEAWIDTPGPSAPAVSAVAFDVPAPGRKPAKPLVKPVAVSASGGQNEAAPATASAPLIKPAPENGTDASRKVALAPMPPRKPAKPRRVVTPARKAAKKSGDNKGPVQAKKKEPKCVALSRCREAFAKCKDAYVKKTGRWDLSKEPCGAKYKACIKAHFEPGEMFFTRWFWPYKECP